MKLRNFYGWLYSAIVAQRTSGWVETNSSVLNTSGETITLCYNVANSAVYVARTQSFADAGVQIGSSAAEVTYQDYCLGERITAVANATTTYARAFGLGHAKGIFTYSGTYTGEETVTIREIGIYKNILNNSTSVTTTVLFTHSLLENPVTVKPGDSFTVQTELVFGEET